jgi:catechol 2,3-dioxygenase-like lactoylglutathione lyase family enzyme
VRNLAKLKHIAIVAKEPEKTACFYREVFGLEIVGKADSESAEGYYLSDGHINIAILRFKNEMAADDVLATEPGAIHHIGFQVEDATGVDTRLRDADSHPLEENGAALRSRDADGHGGRNVALRYSGPDGVMIDISQQGWVGTEDG